MRFRFVSCIVAVMLLTISAVPAEPLRFEFSAKDANRLQFAPVKAKFVKIELERGGNGSSAIDELEVYGPESKNINLAAATLGSQASASGCIAGYAAHRVEHLNDGVYGNDHSWVAPESDRQSLVCIELSEATLVDTVVFSRDRFGDYVDRLPRTISLATSEDGKEFQDVGDVTFVCEPSRVVVPRKASSWANVGLPPHVPPPPAAMMGEDRGEALAQARRALPVTLPKDWPRNNQGFANLALAEGAKARASSTIKGYAIHRVEHLNDGKLGNDHSWIAERNPCWAEIDLGDVYTVYQVAFGSDSSGKFQDRGMLNYSVLLATNYDKNSHAATWTKVVPTPNDTPPYVQYRTELTFTPTLARYVRIAIEETSYAMAARIDELEVFGRRGEIAETEIVLPKKTSSSSNHNRSLKSSIADQKVFESEWQTTLVDEEYAWLKAFGRADIDPALTNTPYPTQRHPLKIPNDETTLVRLNDKPALDGVLNEPLWQRVSDAVVRVASPGTWEQGASVETHVRAFRADDNLYLAITTNRLLSAHVAVLQTADASGVIALTDSGQLVWRQYRAGSDAVVAEQSLVGVCASRDGCYQIEFAVPLTLLPSCERGVTVRAGMGGRYTPAAGHPIRFYSADIAVVAHNMQSRADDSFTVTLVSHATKSLGVTLENKTRFSLGAGESVDYKIAATSGEIGPEQTLRFTIAEQNLAGVRYLFRYDPVARTLALFDTMITRAARDAATPEEKLRVEHAKTTLDSLHQEKQEGKTNERELFLKARRAKREFLFAGSHLEPLEQILFEKRFPLLPSHNYSDYYDSTWRAGGGIYTLRIPRTDGVLIPEQAEVTELFATTGMSRHPVANFDVSKIYFTNRASNADYWHITEMNPDGSEVRQLTEGPFQDLWPCPLPDGDLAFISTRCRQKFLCWEPQASVLHRMNKDGSDITRLSFANLTEFAPSVARDGRILWTRSEYLDKGADYGHTLWYIYPDGALPELTFGNTVVLPQGYANGREIPDTGEVLCVMISHFGDLNGPVAILDVDQGRLNPNAITSITPEVPWPGYWASCETFREPFPITRDVFLVSHSPRDRFALFVIDRDGNRELLSIDPSLSSMCPTPLHVNSPPLQLSSGLDSELATRHQGVFTIEDVYQGIDHIVPRGSAKYVRVSQEMPHYLEKYPDGTYRASYQPFMEFYASPVDLVWGPHGWTSYVAKGDIGTVELEKDGSVSFFAPSEKVLFFQLLDKDYNEIQRMRSVVQLQPGESRSCIGCHEDRAMLSTRRQTIAAQNSPKTLMPSPWGTGAFDYQKTVQPVWNQHCASCHDGSESAAGRIDLTGTLDGDYIPASFKTVIRGGYVHHFNWGYQAGVPTKAEPYSFGTFQTRLWAILGDENHKQIELPEDASRAIKCWIDLSCPLWPDYKQRRLRGDANAHDGTVLVP